MKVKCHLNGLAGIWRQINRRLGPNSAAVATIVLRRNRLPIVRAHPYFHITRRTIVSTVGTCKTKPLPETQARMVACTWPNESGADESGFHIAAVISFQHRRRAVGAAMRAPARRGGGWPTCGKAPA